MILDMEDFEGGSEDLGLYLSERLSEMIILPTISPVSVDLLGFLYDNAITTDDIPKPYRTHPIVKELISYVELTEFTSLLYFTRDYEVNLLLNRLLYELSSTYIGEGIDVEEAIDRISNEMYMQGIRHKVNVDYVKIIHEGFNRIEKEVYDKIGEPATIIRWFSGLKSMIAYI